MSLTFECELQPLSASQVVSRCVAEATEASLNGVCCWRWGSCIFLFHTLNGGEAGNSIIELCRLPGCIATACHCYNMDDDSCVSLSVEHLPIEVSGWTVLVQVEPPT